MLQIKCNINNNYNNNWIFICSEHLFFQTFLQFISARKQFKRCKPRVIMCILHELYGWTDRKPEKRKMI